jgi:hypothetical protein
MREVIFFRTNEAPRAWSKDFSPSQIPGINRTNQKGSTTMNNEASQQGVYYCDGCSTVPLDQLGLEPPFGGWKAALESRGYQVLRDDIGRPAIVRSLAQVLYRERAEQRARFEEKQAAKAAQRPRRSKQVTVPARGDMTPFQAMVAASGDYRTPEQEFSGRPGAGSVARELMEQELAAGG